jgi:hypothetical protein
LLHETRDVFMTAVVVSCIEDKHYHSVKPSQFFRTCVLSIL